jgi:hypothetical protein
MASVASCAAATSVKIGGLPPEATTDAEGGTLTVAGDGMTGDAKRLDAVAETLTEVGAPDGVVFVAWVVGLHAAKSTPTATIPANLNARTARPRRRR